MNVDPTSPPPSHISIGSREPPPPANAGNPPDVMPRKRATHGLDTSGLKLVGSLFLLAPRLLIGAAYLASATVKGLVAGVAVGAAKTGIFKGKTDAVKSFASASWRDTRRDLSKGLLLSLAGLLAPIGHLWSVWDKHENRGEATEFSPTNFGSNIKIRLFYPLGAKLQDILVPDRTPDPHPHTWKKIEAKLDKFADLVTHFKGIENALVKGREETDHNYIPPKAPDGPKKGP